MEFNDSIQQEIENYCTKCNSFFWADYQLISEKLTFYQNTLKSHLTYNQIFVFWSRIHIIIFTCDYRYGLKSCSTSKGLSS